MNNFDMPEFTRSAFALGLGMCTFVGLVAWRTQGNIAAICMSAGLPIGVFSLWAVHAIKMQYFVQLKNVPASRKAKHFGLESPTRQHANLYPPLAQSRSRRPTISARARDRETQHNKERLLTGRQEASELDFDDIKTTKPDQWHQG